MRLFSACLATGAFAALAGQALAQTEPQSEPEPKVEIIAWDTDGKPDRVRVDGYEYKLCKGGQTDSCINPQDAGFDWGGREIKYWPGRPASEIDGPLPDERPEDKTAQPTSEGEKAD
jgi:hypothetical protein